MIRFLKYIIVFLTLFLYSITEANTIIDTLKVRESIDSIKKFRNSNLDSSLSIAMELEKDIDKLVPYHALRVDAINQIAISYAVIGDAISAHKFFKLNTESDTAKLNNQVKGSVFNNVAISYMDLGKYADAIKNFIVALKYREKLNNSSEIAATYSNIGLCYFRQDIYENALKSYYKGLNKVINPDFNDTSLFAKIHSNIGLIFLDNKQLDSAQYHFETAQKFHEMINEVYDLCGIYAYLSELYIHKGDMDKALFYNYKSLQLSKEIGNEYDYYLGLIDLAQIYFHKGRIDETKPLLDTLYKFYTFRNDKWQLINIYDFYSNYYQEKNDFKTALNYKDSVLQLKDSILSKESLDKQKELEAIYENDKQQLLIENLSKENEAKNAIIAKENIQKIAFAVGLFLMIIIVVITFNAYKSKSRSQQLITEQKNAIELKSKEITDSIQYAKRIQTAILPPDSIITESFKDIFVLYMPKDIVAGDFYWFEKQEDLIYFAAADCTGHGVPGAMVSVICNNALNKSLREHNITEPAKILDNTREIILKEFEKSIEEVKDGMDISLCMFNKVTNLLQWSGANNPLWILRNGATEIEEIKANKQPIGKTIDPKPFTNNSVSLQKGDAIYIFTDGYQDQFGGPKGKKFKGSQLKQLLLTKQSRSMEQQKELLISKLKEWQGEHEQVDDICVIGVRI